MNVQDEAEIEQFDVIIVGAGISGIGSACHLKTSLPDKSFLILDEQDAFGGTWRTHRYPGVRSDSDLYTFGYRFKPWVHAPIASREGILSYMGEVIEENELDRCIRYGHRILAASWSSRANLWTVEAERIDTGERRRFTANFLWMCQGYYRHAQGYTPDWPGSESFTGPIVHPQTWPEDLDYAGKRVVVIGSGATAATLVPALAPAAGHVTMLQRSPTYFIPGRNVDELAETLRTLDIDEAWIHEIVRRKRLKLAQELTRRSFEDSEALTRDLLAGVAAYVGPEITEQHFTPSYRPWRQRIAFVPDGDIFQAISDNKASVVTDEIDRFTERGLRLKSGQELAADIVITATGFSLCVLGDIEFTVDGAPLDISETVTYRGMMFTGVPNLVWVWGYFRASWTLRVDIVGDFVCRLLRHMTAREASRVTVALRPQDEDQPRLPWMDPGDFNPGYMMRDLDKLPRRIDRPEWRLTQDFWSEKDVLPQIDLDGAEFVYGQLEEASPRRPERPKAKGLPPLASISDAVFRRAGYDI